MSLVIKKPAGTDPRDHFWFLRHRADVLKCCGNVDNLFIQDHGNKTYTGTCTKCGRVHRKMVAEPGVIFAKPTLIERGA